MWHNYNHRFQQFLGAQFTCSCSGFFHFWDLLDLILVCVKILTHPFLNRDDEDDDMLVFLPAWSDLYLPLCQILWQPWWWWARRVSRCSMHRSTLFSSVAHHTATPFNKGSSWSCLGTQSCLKGPQSDFIDQTLTYLPKYTGNQQEIQAGRRFKIRWKLWQLTFHILLQAITGIVHCSPLSRNLQAFPFILFQVPSKSWSAPPSKPDRPQSASSPPLWCATKA